MDVKGFGAGWRAGVQDANAAHAITRDMRGGNVQGAVQTAGEVVSDLADRGRDFAQRLAGNALHLVGRGVGAVSPDVGAAVERAASRIDGARHEGRAQSSLQRAGSSFKKAWTAAFRAYKNDNIKGLGANLAFSVASWGSNMKEGMKNLACAIGNGFKALGTWIKRQI
jgi:hypothetical protein